MKKFTAHLNDGSFVNINADEMRMEECYILVYNDKKLVAFLDISVVLAAHLSERSVSECKN